MERSPQKWSLPDLVDFEVLLKEAGDREVSRRDREAVAVCLKGASGLSRGDSLRRGLRAWLEERRTQTGETSGERVALALRFTALLAGLVGFLAGTSVMRGLLYLNSDGDRAYHLWIFLSVTIGLQWLVLILSLLVIFVMRGKGRRVSIVGEFLGGIARWLTGKAYPGVWDLLWNPLSGAGRVTAWRLTRLSQGMGVAFNAGLLAGFLGCLWFFEVTFDLESTFVWLAYPQFFSVAETLALPWEWTGIALAPSMDQLEEFDLLSGDFSFTLGGRNQCIAFLFMAMAVWGLLPRLLLWGLARRGEARALGSLRFQERRHRALWRQLVRHQSEERFEGPADGVVLINVGGVEVDETVLGEFLLRGLRVHADEMFEAVVLDERGEERAIEAIRKAPLGVVFLVEGWALSPKQMLALYERVREVDGERPIRFLVLGELQDGRPGPPEPEEAAQWEAFVDGLRDPAAEVSLFKPLQPVRAES